MAKLLKLRRGTTSQHSSFTGAEGELTVDTTKDTAVVHDGSTQGGRPLLREDLNNMPASGVSAGTYGSSTALPVITVDAKGLVTSATTSAIDSTAITNGTSNVSVTNNADITFTRSGTERFRIDSSGGRLLDSNKMQWGDANDLQIYHDGNNSYIDETGTGQLFIRAHDRVNLQKYTGETCAQFIADGAVNLYYDAAIKFSTKADGVDVAGEVQCDSLDVDGGADFTGEVTLHNNLKLHDNDALKLGSGNDLQLYHNNNNSYIKEEGTGELRIGSNNQVRITKHDSETLALFNVDGGAELYYDNSKKFETVPGGGKVSGHLEITGDINLSGELNLMGGTDTNKYLDIRLGSSTFTMRGTSGGDGSHENLAKFNRNGSVELFYDNNRKFHTASNGAVVTGTLTATTLEGDGIVPQGAIIMWSGAQNAIPSGYVICDGNNGTPNLYNRFIVGAGSSYAVGATGGTSSITLATGNLPGHTHSTGNHSHGVNSHTHSTPNHSHGVNSHTHSTPNHNHNMNSHAHNGSTSGGGSHAHNISVGVPNNNRVNTPDVLQGWGRYDHLQNYSTANVGNHSHNFSTSNAASNTNTSGGGTTGSAGANTTNSGGGTSGSAGANTTSVSAGTTGSTGSGQAIENRPPYYALCYIMKT